MSDEQRPEAWFLRSEVVRLRLAGEALCFPLDGLQVPSTNDGYVLGTAPTCDFQVKDPKGLVSRQHARLLRRNGGWYIRALAPKNGLFVDDVRQDFARLTSGMELRLGSLTFIAEGLPFVELRCAVARYLGWGWGDERAAAIDLAMQVLRQAALQRRPVWLSGLPVDELRSIGFDLHKRMCGPGAPFSVLPCQPSIGADAARTWLAEQRGAWGGLPGTLCLLAGRRLPEGLGDFLSIVGAEVQCIVVTQRAPKAASDWVICVPSLLSREAQRVEHVAREMFLDETAELGQARLPTQDQLAWLLTHASSFARLAVAANTLARCSGIPAPLPAVSLPRAQWLRLGLRRWWGCVTAGRSREPARVADATKRGDGGG